MSSESDLRFESDAALADLVAAFERGQVPEGGFSHQAHLAVALLYLERYGLEGALSRMRSGLLTFLERAFGDAAAARVKYRETTTGFWIRLLARELAATDPQLPLFERVNPLLARYRDASTIHRFYSDERLDSEEARRRYLEPDLQPLPAPGSGT